MSSSLTLAARKQGVLVLCKNCGEPIPTYAVVDGKKRNLHTRKYCLKCVPFGSNGCSVFGRQKRDYGKCLNCGNPLKKSNKKFCSVKCEHDYPYKEYIRKWKNGEVSGTIGKAWIDVSGYVKRYIFEKFDFKCSKCGWSERNPYTNTLPLEIEHIDGDATNNCEENLTLLCHNCHSLTKTYRGANKGNGSRGIKWLSRDGKTTNNAE